MYIKVVLSRSWSSVSKDEAIQGVGVGLYRTPLKMQNQSVGRALGFCFAFQLQPPHLHCCFEGDHLLLDNDHHTPFASVHIVHLSTLRLVLLFIRSGPNRGELTRRCAHLIPTDGTLSLSH